MTDKEHEQWKAAASAGPAAADEEWDRIARSREAMIIDGQEQHVAHADEYGQQEPIRVQTTTLITEHMVPEEEQQVGAVHEVHEERPAQEEQREPSQGSEGNTRQDFRT